MTDRLFSYLETSKLISECQHGFRKNRSTESALLQFTSDVYKCLENKLFTVGLFLDFSKAFDSLSHDILFDKLYNLGITGTPLALLKNYLTDRKQFVFCNSYSSAMNMITKGVPQKSMLGPLLFLVYINDIVNCSSKFRFVLYADDTNLLLSDRNIPSLHENLISEFDKVLQWLNCNKLMLNVNKTKLMFFQNHSVRNILPPFQLNNQTIAQVEQAKFLGVQIDCNLNWKFHIDCVCSKLSKTCGILYKIRNQLTKDTLISIYYTLCYPLLIYCLPIWGCTWPSFLHTIFVAQKKILRCILYKKRYDSVLGDFTRMNLLQFPFVLKYFVTIFVHKNLHVHNDIFKYVEHSYNTRRNNLNLINPEYRTTLVKNSILCNGPTVWNYLPNEIKSTSFSCNTSTFKCIVKKHFQSLQAQKNR